jgi:predicted transcriptional regulator
MHFNVYIDDETGQELNRAAEQSGETRNALIRKAVSAWLHRQAPAQWPDAVLEFEGMPDMVPFEDSRDQLQAPSDDPLA